MEWDNLDGRVTKRLDWDRRKNHMRHIPPIAHAQINLKGTITFDIEQHRNPDQNKGKAHQMQQMDATDGHIQ
ncbi:hypothetical protein [uncultured Ruegeria sp.]|uniref:hypothetical protein n=1 Tax=uncultured Ruegeria sp. TaxID=259304 RepID=UPI002629CBF2|nr:hypothetical protein [uncultured Ruegeria sp.]